MPVFSPAPQFNFQIFMFDASTELPSSFTEVLSGATRLGLGFGLSFLFGSFSEVNGLTAEIETEEYREGGRNHGPRQFAKWGRYPVLEFKRGVTFNTDIWDWYYQVLYGSQAPIRKNGIVILNDRGGGVVPEGTGLGLPVLDRTPVAVWFFSNGLPSRLIGPSLDARGNEIAIETLEITHESLVRVGPAQIPGIGEALVQFGL